MYNRWQRHTWRTMSSCKEVDPEDDFEVWNGQSLRRSASPERLRPKNSHRKTEAENIVTQFLENHQCDQTCQPRKGCLRWCRYKVLAESGWGKELIERNKRDNSKGNSKGCWISTLKASKGDVYPYVHTRFSQSLKVLLHVLSLAVDLQVNGTLPNSAGELQVSHLCHEPRCFNPDHLSLEDGPYNRSRMYCVIFHTDDRHTCLHSPCCIF